MCVFVCACYGAILCARQHAFWLPPPPPVVPHPESLAAQAAYTEGSISLCFTVRHREIGTAFLRQEREFLFFSMCVCVHIHTYIYTPICMYVCMRVCVYACMYTHTHTPAHTCTNTNTRARAHTHTHTLTHTHTHTYTHRSPRSRRTRKSTQSSWPRLVPAPKARHAFSKVLSTVARYIMNALGH